MGDERFGSNYWRSISVRRHTENVGVEGGDEPAREAMVGDQGRSVAHHNFVGQFKSDKGRTGNCGWGIDYIHRQPRITPFFGEV